MADPRARNPSQLNVGAGTTAVGRSLRLDPVFHDDWLITEINSVGNPIILHQRPLLPNEDVCEAFEQDLSEVSTHGQFMCPSCKKLIMAKEIYRIYKVALMRLQLFPNMVKSAQFTDAH